MTDLRAGRDDLKRAFTSFLALPTVVIGLFVLLALATYGLEQADAGWFRPVRSYMQDHVFGDAAATSSLLGTIAGGLITITSITFSLQLLALQQSAGSMSHAVFDQFLRRRLNQLYFAVFIGTTLYSLITLATVNPPFNPILGATVALALTLVALYMLLLLVYSTISQMRPEAIVTTIHDHTLRARRRQTSLLRRTRRLPELAGDRPVLVRSTTNGFLVEIDLDDLAAAIDRAGAPVEVVILRSIGDYVAFQDPVAEVRAGHAEDAEEVAACVVRACRLERQRAFDNDPAHGIEQLATIGWRSVSTSQQNPSPGAAAIHVLSDLLARWVADQEDETEVRRLPVVYPDDVMAKLIGAFESLAVVASEAMQHQTYAAILRSLAGVFDRLPEAEQRLVEELLLRSLAGLGDHILTAELDAALAAIADELAQADRLTSATAIRTARNALAASVGSLNSRSTRVAS